MNSTRIGYMDGIDWQHHIGEGNDPKGSLIFPSVELTRQGRRCLSSGSGCGIVKVEVRLIEWVEEQDFSKERKSKETK